MPPKQQGGGKKVVIDKTFGMKNKKGGAAQKQVKQIQQQQAQTGMSKEVMMKQKKKDEEAKAKLEAEKRKKLEGEIFAVVQPKVPFGADPKMYTCAFWKAGRCEKGSKCKYAHSNEPGRKTDKKDLYTDMREGEAPPEAGQPDERTKDTMDKWDQAKLDSVILSKHGNPKSTTDKVCKFFLQAVEDGKYGWFWECPNGGEKCMYKHRLPPGFVLKSQKKELDELAKQSEISLEDFLETERHKLGTNLTPVTKESFAKWKKERVDKKTAEEEANKKKKEAQVAANKANGLSGREQWTLGSLVDQEEEDGDDGANDFDLGKYLNSGWKQERQEEAEEEAQHWSGDEDDDEENGGKSTSVNGDGEDEDGQQQNGSASASRRASTVGSTKGVEEGLDKLKVDGDGAT